MTQAQALTILKTGGNVFLTGEPGSGKTHTVNAYVRYLRDCGIEPAITASTGIAATHIHGMTIHSWSGIGIRKDLTEYDLDKIASNEYVAKRIVRAHVLIIDEISMLDADTLTLVDAVCKAVRNSDLPFGGLQVVLVGDFFQLPPVIKNPFGHDESQLFGEDRQIFAFQSPAWRNAQFLTCYLTEQHRQEDAEFLSVLSAIRTQAVGPDHRERLTKRKFSPAELPDGMTKLFSHNADVDRVNFEELVRLPGTMKTYKMSSTGSEFLVMGLKKGCLSPEKLELKVGAAVMFTKNNPNAGYANGTVGTVAAFQAGTGSPLVRTRSGKVITVLPLEWALEDAGKVRAKISQLPLRLAWAITIHKSQGMSLDAAVIDLNSAFEYGQGYVALSRVRTLDGLHLLGFNERSLEVNPAVGEKDEQFRIASEEAREAFANLEEKEIAKMHDNFIAACGGKKRVLAAKKEKPAKKSGEGKSAGKIEDDFSGTGTESGTKSLSRLDLIRQKYPNAYRPWLKEEDDRLKVLFAEGRTQKDLSQEFGRQKGSIRARLVKLGLIEDDRLKRPSGELT